MNKFSFKKLSKVGLGLVFVGLFIMFTCFLTSNLIPDVVMYFFWTGLALVMLSTIGTHITNRGHITKKVLPLRYRMVLNALAMVLFGSCLILSNILKNSSNLAIVLWLLLLIGLILLSISFQTKKDFEDEFTRLCIQKSNAVTLYSAFVFLVTLALLLNFHILPGNAAANMIAIILSISAIIRAVTFLILEKRGITC